MKSSRYAYSRQKACQACVAAKAKCDRRPACCSRCGARGQPCVYPPRPPGRWEALDDGSTGPAAEPRPAGSVLDVGDGELVCPIQAGDICIRWMSAYVPTPEQTVKPYRPSTIAFLHRVLQSYAGMAVCGSGLPPFIHPQQLAGENGNGNSSMESLQTCLRLARTCDPARAGGSSATADAGAAVLMREMDRLYAAFQGLQRLQQGDGGPGISDDGHGAPPVDHTASLSLFQAYLLYALVLFFQLGRQADPFLRQAIMALQDIAATSCQHGLVCAAEQQQAGPQSHGRCPRWAAWVVAEAKRRTLYTMYLFDSVLSAHDGLVTCLGVELRGLSAPASRELWRAQSPAEWATAYGVHRDAWAGDALRIDELWPAPLGTDAAARARRRQRIGRWLGGVDEYGMMLYAVTSCTHEE